MTYQYYPNFFYQWSKRGDTPVMNFEADRGKRVNYFGALCMSDKRQVVHMGDHKKSEDFINFLELVLEKYKSQISAGLEDHLAKLAKDQVEKSVPKLYRGMILVVLDNASIHKSKEVKAWLEEHYGMIEFMNLPPYCPDLNPQERVWKALRKEISTYQGVRSFGEIVDHSCFFLMSRTFNYKMEVSK